MELTAETTFTVLAAPEVFQEYEDLYLFPENSGTNALRELRYPGDVLPPFIYETNPDRWENFDSAPMTDRPQVRAEMTLASTQIVRWRGYYPDKPVREIWRGADNKSRMSAYMLRRLYEYFATPPVSGYITWSPKDRTEQEYLIQIESLSVGGQDVLTFDLLALKADLVPLEVVFQFRIVREA
ncbi:MAG: hypothetical protein FJ135_01855 [Deltaproteobacteria bacterium]|nr:hypothetical protein [Deltaproteobacteria bacterium]